MSAKSDVLLLAFWAFVVGSEFEAGHIGSLWCTVALIAVGFHGWALLLLASPSTTGGDK